MSLSSRLQVGTRSRSFPNKSEMRFDSFCHAERAERILEERPFLSWAEVHDEGPNKARRRIKMAKNPGWVDGLGKDMLERRITKNAQALAMLTGVY